MANKKISLITTVRTLLACLPVTIIIIKYVLYLIRYKHCKTEWMRINNNIISISFSMWTSIIYLLVILLFRKCQEPKGSIKLICFVIKQQAELSFYPFFDIFKSIHYHHECSLKRNLNNTILWSQILYITFLVSFYLIIVCNLLMFYFYDQTEEKWCKLLFRSIILIIFFVFNIIFMIFCFVFWLFAFSLDWFTLLYIFIWPFDLGLDLILLFKYDY